MILHLKADELNGERLLTARIWELACRDGLPFTWTSNRESEASPDEVLRRVPGVVVAKHDGSPWMVGVLAKTQQAAICVRARTTQVGAEYWLSVAATTMATARRVGQALLAHIPPLAPKDPTVVPVNFWALDASNHPVRRRRYVAASTWTEIRDNYAAEAKRKLADLLILRPPVAGGQLILLHGKAGTGKTYGIRALARAWRPWCDTSYIVDPDKFFGYAHYMLSVMLDTEGEQATEGSAVPGPSYGEATVPAHERWHLLIVEDADELLTLDAKTRVGQAFSRLLNLVEGMVGQGLRVLVLMTTNEPIDKMHPAVIRPGRCLTNIHFDELPPEEAERWLRLREGPAWEPRGGATIADLYARLRGVNPNGEAAGVGYAARR